VFQRIAVCICAAPQPPCSAIGRFPSTFHLSAARSSQFNGGNQSSNGGLLLLREKERALAVCRRLAEAMPDRRDTDSIRHAMLEMLMARVAAIACGNEDANDLDRLRHDPLMKLAVGRCPQSGAALASQSTISPQSGGSQLRLARQTGKMCRVMHDWG
jgi:hypothetical protein